MNPFLPNHKQRVAELVAEARAAKRLQDAMAAREKRAPEGKDLRNRPHRAEMLTALAAVKQIVYAMVAEARAAKRLQNARQAGETPSA